MISVELSWRWTPFARRLIVLAGLALVCAFALGRPALVVIAAAPLAWLALAATRPEPRTATVRISHPERCVERESLPVAVAVELDGGVELLGVAFAPGPGFRLGEPAFATVAGATTAELTVTVAAPRWGRHALGLVHVEAWQRRRLRQAHAVVHAQTEVSVLPRPVPLDRLPIGSTRYDRVGEHPAAAAGSGVEFHTVRPFAPGDRPRRINWSASTRRGGLYVNSVRAERSVDVVVAVDVLAETGPPGRSSRDLALRGATGLARAALRTHDRVGLVAVGGRLSWLRPDLGERQFYRIAEAMLEVVDWASFVDPDVDAIPYPALPSGAHVLFLSPLVDERGAAAAVTLRRRGHPVTVIDVCTGDPDVADERAELARRLWRLDRAATRNRLAELGVTVVGWDGSTALDALLAPAVRATERAAR